MPRSVKTGRAAAVEMMGPWLAMDPDFAVFVLAVAAARGIQG